MKTSLVWKVFSLALLGAIWLSPVGAWAHLPHPAQSSGVVLAMDHDAKSLVLKFAKDKKPVVLDWNKNTEFIQNGQVVSSATLTNGARVRIVYRNISFRNPFLLKVIWQEPARSP